MTRTDLDRTAPCELGLGNWTRAGNMDIECARDSTERCGTSRRRVEDLASLDRKSGVHERIGRRVGVVVNPGVTPLPGEKNAVERKSLQPGIVMVGLSTVVIRQSQVASAVRRRVQNRHLGRGMLAFLSKSGRNNNPQNACRVRHTLFGLTYSTFRHASLRPAECWPRRRWIPATKSIKQSRNVDP